MQEKIQELRKRLEKFEKFVEISNDKLQASKSPKFDKGKPLAMIDVGVFALDLIKQGIDSAEANNSEAETANISNLLSNMEKTYKQHSLRKKKL